MDGYSVEEAAEVLGIPQGRVWELIARGVLAGASEGHSDMRVFLKPSASDPLSRAPGGEGPSVGNGGAHLEPSPFRELLTEFRNLTERYGQALLALGEARGEVAALRSRVDLLEARMDMRLPLRAASTVAWEMPDLSAQQRAAPQQPVAEPSTAEPEPATAEPEPATAELEPVAAEEPEAPMPGQPVTEQLEPAQAAEPAPEPGELVDEAPAPPPAPPEVLAPWSAEPVAEGLAPVEPSESEESVEPLEPAAPATAERSEVSKRRISGTRAAVAGLAEALARAEDPTLADLPGAREAAEALAALEHEMASRPPPSEAPAPIEAEIPLEGGAAESGPIEGAEEALPSAFAPSMAEVEEEEATVAEAAAPAEPETVVAPSAYTTEVVEPDWFADGDFTWLDAAATEPQVEPEQAPEPEREPTPEAAHLEAHDEGPPTEAIQQAFDEPAAELAEAIQQPVDNEVSAAEEPTEPPPPAEEIQQAFDEPDASHAGEPSRAPGTAADTGLEAWDESPATDAVRPPGDEAGASPASSQEPSWPSQDRYRSSLTGSGSVGFGLFRGQAAAGQPAPAVAQPPADEEALLWFGDEFDAAELELATPGWRDQERALSDAAASSAVAPAPPAAAPGPSPDVGSPPVSDEQIDRLAADEGWDSSEVDAIRSYLGRAAGVAQPPTPPASADAAPDLPGAREMQPPAAATPPRTDEAPGQPPASLAADGPMHDQDWLRGRRGPAATAYRRLRRLIQG